MLKKPETCRNCSLFDTGKGWVPDQIAPKAEYILYGEAPGKNEVAEGKPFVGRAGYVLKQWLLKAVPILQLAVERNKVSFCNVLRCLPPEVAGRAYPKGEEKELAEKHCSQYMNLGTAETVILFGESPQRFFFGEELKAEDATDRHLGHETKGVMGRIGRVYEKDDKRWIFAPHPAYILRQPSLVEHGQQALYIASGVNRVVDVTYIDWDTAMESLNGSRSDSIT